MTAFEPAPLGTLDGFFLADGNTLLIESNLNEEGSNIGRRNFTIMHEACHHVLKILFPEDFIRNPYDKRPVPIHYCRAEPRHHEKITDWKEWQTNTLTSAVFLPKQLVEQAMELVGLKGKIKRLNRLFYKQEFDQFTRMTEILGCSKIALSIRMKQLGLIGESYLDNPYRLLDVEVD